MATGSGLTQGMVLDNGAQRAEAQGTAGGQRDRQIKKERC